MTRSPVLLCVDSDATGLLIRTAVLETAHYSIITAPDANFALAILRAIPVDLLITEQALPSMPGTELARLCKCTRPSTRVLLLTFSPYGPPALYADAQLCKLEGPVALLEKVNEMLETQLPLLAVTATATAASA